MKSVVPWEYKLNSLGFSAKGRRRLSGVVETETSKRVGDSMVRLGPLLEMFGTICVLI